MTTLFDGPHFTFRLLRPNLRRAQRLARDGAPATARIVGIRIRRGNDDSPDHHEWALEVARGGGDTVRVGCRQRLSTERLERLRLGDEVRVLVDDRGGTLIDDEDDLTRAQLSHKVLKDPPLDGIYDENADLTKERRKATAAHLVVRGAERVTVLGMETMNIRLEVEVRPEGQPPYEATHQARARPVLRAAPRRGRHRAARYRAAGQGPRRLGGGGDGRPRQRRSRGARAIAACGEAQRA